MLVLRSILQDSKAAKFLSSNSHRKFGGTAFSKRRNRCIGMEYLYLSMKSMKLILLHCVSKAGYNSMRKAFVGLHNIVEYYSYRYWVLVEGPCLANESILNLLFLNSLDMDTIHFHFHFFSAILVAQCCAWPRTALLTWTRIS